MSGKMDVTIECANCESPMNVYTRLDGAGLTVMVDPCPVCIARSIINAEEQEWVRAKLLKEGRIVA